MHLFSGTFYFLQFDIAACSSVNKDIRTKGHAGKIDEFLGARLRLFRQIANFSQETLALSIGITFQQVQKYEKGTNRISAARLFQLSRILNVRLDDFFDGFEAKTDNKAIKLLDNMPIDFLPLLQRLSEIPDEKDRKAVLKAISSVIGAFYKTG